MRKVVTFIWVAFGIMLSQTSLPAQCPPVYTFTGQAADDALGWSVSGAGDVDGDGYDDVIVGAIRSDAGGPQSGKVYAYSGQSGATLFEITGEQPGNQLGGAIDGVSSVGDFNGDGYDDIVIGARFHHGVGSNSGRAYLFLGGPGPYPVLTGASSADMIISGESTGDRLGYSTSNAGDVNGDGYDDLIISATQDYSGGTAVGRAYVFFGRSGAFPSSVSASAADMILIGEAPGHFFGLSVSGAGDANSDGFDDLLVGAPQSESAGTGGTAYVFLGRSGPFPTTVLAADADMTFSGEAAGDFFGASVSDAGDINKDGFDDIFIGATYSDAGGVDAGQAHVFFGGPGPFPAMISAAAADIIVTGQGANDWFGCTVSGVGDVNCDGYPDLLVGAAPWDYAAPSSSGQAYLFFGNLAPYPITIPAADADVIFYGEAVGDLFGASASGAGDINGDGCDDLIVGAPKNDAGGADAGRAYVYACLSPVISVALDIKPGSCPNPLNIKPSSGGGAPDDKFGDGAGGNDGPERARIRAVLPAAIMGTAEFDVMDIDPTTLTLEGVLVKRWSYEDVGTPVSEGSEECDCSTEGPDGFTDLAVKFDEQAIVDALGEVHDGQIVNLALTGELVDGTPIEGMDCVVIRGKKKPPVVDDATKNGLLPGEYALGQNHPNPFNPSTEISYSLMQAGQVRLEVFNTLGQKVATLLDEYSEAGAHSVSWDASAQASGVYFYRLTAGEFVETKKMMLLK